jgi:hypothetical protein
MLPIDDVLAVEHRRFVEGDSHMATFGTQQLNRLEPATPSCIFLPQVEHGKTVFVAKPVQGAVAEQEIPVQPSIILPPGK